MASWWLADLWQLDRVLAVSWVVWVIGSIVLHELGHGWAALACGDRTPIESGHMTWNPVVHMGPISLLFFALVGIAWGAMPVDPSRFRPRFGNAIVALAGPAMNLLLALGAVVLLVLWIGLAGGFWIGGVRAPDPLWQNMQTFLLVGIKLNIVLMLFNLLPVPPLDGSRILGDLVPGFGRLFQSDKAVLVAFILFLLLFRFSGSALFEAADQATRGIVRTMLSLFVPGASAP